MAGRISLLILMTALFAAAWSTDHPPGRTVAPVLPDQRYQSDSVRETALRRWPITSYQRVVDASQEWAPQSFADLPIESDRPIADSTPILPDQRAAALLAQILTGKWIDACQLLHGQLAAPLSTRMTSQPKSGDVHRH